jgi:putative oxidoreductase
MAWLTDPWMQLFGWGGHLEWGVVPLRLALGWIFLYSGARKYRGGIAGTGEWMRSLGLPAPQLLARWTASIEVAGGALLIVGLATSWVAIPLAVNMLGATYTQKLKLHAPFGGGDVQGYELDVLMVAGSVALALLGAGALSLDALIGR